MDLFISLSRGDIFATKEVHFDLQHLRNGFRNTRDQQQNHLDTSWYCERLMMMMMFEVVMLLMIVINPRECLFWNRKQCCFCVCSLRVDVRMSAASGGKFCVNIFCFQDPPPTLCGLYISPVPQETCCFKVQIEQHHPQSSTCVVGAGCNLWYQPTYVASLCLSPFLTLHVCCK